MKIKNLQDANDYIYTFNYYALFNEDKQEKVADLLACKKIAETHADYKLLCRTRTFLLYHYIEEQQLQKATETAHENLKLAKDNEFDSELLFMIPVIAHLYQLTGNYSASEELVQIALDAVSTLNDFLKQAKTYLMIAEQYFFTNKKENCIQAYNKSIELALKTQDNGFIAICYNNYADKLIKYELFDELIKVIDAGYEYALKAGDKIFNVFYYEKFAGYYSHVKDYKKARKYLTKALSIYRKQNNHYRELQMQLDLIKLFLESKAYSKAFPLLKKTEEQALQSDIKPVLLKIYWLLVRYYEEKNKYKDAFTYLRKYNEVNAFIYNQESEEKIKNLQIQHEVKSIKASRDTAEKLAKVKHDFLANMSHEIRTPINSILGIGYLLGQEQLSEKQQQYIRRLNHSGQQLLGIINDVLDISKIEAGKFQLVPVPMQLKTVAENIVSVLSIKASEKKLDFIFNYDETIPEICIGDPNRIGQILNNLISNAIKFTETGFVRLDIRKVHANGNMLTLAFHVMDSGIGLSDSQKEKIFNEYEQAEKYTQVKFGGTGLGLSISKKLAELMNGNIKVESIQNTGTTFTLEIPMEISTESISITNEITTLDSLNGKIIYVADDVEENRLIMSELLLTLNKNIQIEFAVDGNEIIALVQRKIPDILFMDLDMPEINGIMATAKIREFLNNKPCTIIACTASLLTLSKDELLSMGFQNLLLKPYTINQLGIILTTS
ncbi:MAG: ATP-binding protein [Chitinophagales bacterium]